MLRDIDSQSRLTDVQRPLNLPPTLKEVAQPFGHRQNPLPHRQRRENVIDQVAAVSAMRRLLHEGHIPRHLQE
jgi:hypothetical protein